MKKLLNKTLKPFTIYASIVLAASIPVYFLLVDWIWLKELDENNGLIAERIENEFNQQNINDEKLEESITFWNEIQPGSKIEYSDNLLQKDSTYTIIRQKNYSGNNAIDRFRGLKRSIQINQKNFIVTIETNVEETEETVAYIAAVTLLFFLILVIGFWVLNRKLSKTLWIPFNDTLQKLKSFNLNHRTQIEFRQSDTVEFNELNTALNKLIKHSISAYQNQKEFTENASHELQTPIAIIKNKLDLLLQDRSITEQQYELIEEINITLSRMSRINKNLLLLAKIENKQFDDTEEFSFAIILRHCMNELEDFIADKRISMTSSIEDKNSEIQANKTLMEILINNLLLNAIRHSEVGNSIIVKFANKELIISNIGEYPLDETALFDRFKKMDSNQNGSGLGLAIAKEICKNNGWIIRYNFHQGRHHFLVKM